jgi:hypothetical protein
LERQGGVDWIHLAQDRDKSFVNAVMNHRVPQLVTSRVALSYIEFIIYTTISWLCSVMHFQGGLGIENAT